MADHSCIKEETLRQMLTRIDRNEKAIFVGNGHPSMITEIATIKQSLSSLVSWGRFIGGAIILELIATTFRLLHGGS